MLLRKHHGFCGFCGGVKRLVTINRSRQDQSYTHDSCHHVAGSNVIRHILSAYIGTIQATLQFGTARPLQIAVLIGLTGAQHPSKDPIILPEAEGP
ncbi:hypothetical protein CIB48_g7484 [Xylaria polymorpha]|nr:hypothetical protein CIB48_g7484 [Xylaria polymorpha]